MYNPAESSPEAETLNATAATGPRARTRWVSLLINLALAGGMLVLAIALAEGVVRMVTPQQLILLEPGLWQPTDSVGYTFRAGLDRRINTGERPVSLVTDDRGFRIGRHPGPLADTRVLLLGDSFMAALQVDFEDSFAGLMERDLSAALGRPVRVENAAVDGWGPAEYYYRTINLLNEAPRSLLVTAVFVGNDAVDGLAPPRPPVVPAERKPLRWPSHLSWTALVQAWLRPVNDFLETHSHVFILAKSSTLTLRMKLGLAPEYFPIEFLRTELDSPRWETTAAVMAEIADTARTHGVETVFVLIPPAFQVDSLVLVQYLAGFGVEQSEVDVDRPTRLLHEAMERQGLNVVDVLATFREAHVRGDKLYGTVDRHLSPEGHALLWRTVRPVVGASLGVDRETAPGPS